MRPLSTQELWLIGEAASLSRIGLAKHLAGQELILALDARGFQLTRTPEEEMRAALRLARLTLKAKGGCTAAERDAAVAAIDVLL